MTQLQIGNAWSAGDGIGRELMLEVADEVALVARAEGIDLSDEVAREAVTFVAENA